MDERLEIFLYVGVIAIVWVIFGAWLGAKGYFYWDEETKEEKMPTLQDAISAVKQYANRLLSWLRSLFGTPPKAEKARQRARKKKAGV